MVWNLTGADPQAHSRSLVVCLVVTGKSDFPEEHLLTPTWQAQPARACEPSPGCASVTAAAAAGAQEEPLQQVMDLQARALRLLSRETGRPVYGDKILLV